MAKVIACVGWGFFVEFWREETGGTEEEGFEVVGVFFECGERHALGEEAHWQGVGAIAEGLCGGLIEGGVAAVSVGCFQESRGFGGGAMF